jgi:hypothetical protein
MMLSACRRVITTTAKANTVNNGRFAPSTLIMKGGIRYFSKERAGKSVKPGCAIILDGQPHRCTKMIQGKRGKGGGFIRATLKNILTNNTFEKTFTSDEIVEHADLERMTAG